MQSQLGEDRGDDRLDRFDAEEQLRCCTSRRTLPTPLAGGTTRPPARLQVVGAIAYGLVVLRVATWLPPESRLRAAIGLIGLIGMAGNVTYGFEAIHQSLGHAPLVDQAGAANLIKPLGLCFPLSFALLAAALVRLGHRWQGAVVLAAIIGWPVAHIGNIAAVAVPVNVALVIAFGSLLWAPAPAGSTDARH